MIDSSRFFSIEAAASTSLFSFRILFLARRRKNSLELHAACLRGGDWRWHDVSPFFVSMYVCPSLP
jgi:hypothetical protein